MSSTTSSLAKKIGSNGDWKSQGVYSTKSMYRLLWIQGGHPTHSMVRGLHPFANLFIWMKMAGRRGFERLFCRASWIRFGRANQ